jgi:hypothetical protein
MTKDGFTMLAMSFAAPSVMALNKGASPIQRLVRRPLTRSAILKQSSILFLRQTARLT